MSKFVFQKSVFSEYGRSLGLLTTRLFAQVAYTSGYKRLYLIFDKSVKEIDSGSIAVTGAFQM
jgi:hypothetical protein